VINKKKAILCCSADWKRGGGIQSFLLNGERTALPHWECLIGKQKERWAEASSLFEKLFGDLI
jgi:hypothetical protein